MSVSSTAERSSGGIQPNSAEPDEPSGASSNICLSAAVSVVGETSQIASSESPATSRWLSEPSQVQFQPTGTPDKRAGRADKTTYTGNATDRMATEISVSHNRMPN